MISERQPFLDYADLGIPQGFYFRGLVVDSIGSFLVAKFSHRAGPPNQSYWTKAFSDDVYQPLCGVVPDKFLYQTCALDAAGGKLYVNVMYQRPRDDGSDSDPTDGWDWFGIDCYDLASGTKLSCVNKCFVGRAVGEVWIADLIAQSQEVGHVIARVGMLHAVKGGNFATYHICNLNVANGHATILADLRATAI
jgi:hypothetical protein